MTTNNHVCHWEGNCCNKVNPAFDMEDAQSCYGTDNSLKQERERERGTEEMEREQAERNDAWRAPSSHHASSNIIFP